MAAPHSRPSPNSRLDELEERLAAIERTAQLPFSTIPPAQLDGLLSDGNPLAVGTAGPGESANASRADHTHPDDGLATDVELTAHTGAVDPHGTGAALTTHIDNATDAHDASAVSYDGTTSTLAATDVQAAVDENAADLVTHAAVLGDAGHIDQQTGIADLAMTVTDPPTTAEVQAVADKLDIVLAALRAAGIIAT